MNRHTVSVRLTQRQLRELDELRTFLDRRGGSGQMTRSDALRRAIAIAWGDVTAANPDEPL